MGSGITDQDEESGREEDLHQADIEEKFWVFEETHLGLSFKYNRDDAELCRLFTLRRFCVYTSQDIDGRTAVGL